MHTPIDSVEVILGFRGEYDDVTAIPIVNQLGKIVKNLKGVINNEGIIGDASTDVLYIKFSLIGSNKVDVAYRLEQMVSYYIIITFFETEIDSFAETVM